MKNPTISVVATDELLRVLHASDAALKASRKKSKPPLEALHGLIVQVAAARMKVTPVLSAPASDETAS